MPTWQLVNVDPRRLKRVRYGKIRMQRIAMAPLEQDHVVRTVVERIYIDAQHTPWLVKMRPETTRVAARRYLGHLPHPNTVITSMPACLARP